MIDLQRDAAEWLAATSLVLFITFVLLVLA